MPKFILLVLSLLLYSSSAIAQSRYVHRAPFMCLDGDTCNLKTAVENRYPESALYLNATQLDARRTAITVGKDWTANQQPIGFFDTVSFDHAIGDTAYFIDANNDGRQDILFSLIDRSGHNITGTLEKWIVLLQSEHGTFTKLDVQQYGLPLWRRNKHNYWLNIRLIEDTASNTRYWAEDLFDLKGTTFINIGAKYGFPRIREYGGKLPRLTKKLKQQLRQVAPDASSE